MRTMRSRLNTCTQRLTQNNPKRTSLNTKRTCDDDDEDEDEDEDEDDDDDDDDERYRYDQRSNMFKF